MDTFFHCQQKRSHLLLPGEFSHFFAFTASHHPAALCLATSLTYYS